MCARRDDLKAFNTGLIAEEGMPSIGEGQLEFSLKLFDLNQVRLAASNACYREFVCVVSARVGQRGQLEFSLKLFDLNQVRVTE